MQVFKYVECIPRENIQQLWFSSLAISLWFEERSVQVKYKLSPYFAAHAMEIVENVSNLEARSYNVFSSISSKVKDCE